MLLCALCLEKVQTSVGLVWSYFDAILESIMRISHFLIPVGYGYLMVDLFWIPFGSVYYARAFIPKQNRPSINIV